MDFAGPLPIEPPAELSPLLASTEEERGLAHLTFALRWVGDDGTTIDREGKVATPGWATAPDGWERFNADSAPELAGDICSGLLLYALEAAGSDGLRRSLRRLLENLAEALG